VWCGVAPGAVPSTPAAAAGAGSTTVAAVDTRIRTALTTLAEVMDVAAAKVKQDSLTSLALQDLVKRVGLFPYIHWQVRRPGCRCKADRAGVRRRMDMAWCSCVMVCVCGLVMVSVCCGWLRCMLRVFSARADRGVPHGAVS